MRAESGAKGVVMLYIRDNRTLQRFVDSLGGVRALALDTEFVREGSYEPHLALLQIATDRGEVVVVDPFAASPLEPLFAVLADRSIEKVLHSGQQDISILATRMGRVPEALFDTQVAAAFLGYGERIGLADLLAGELEVQLEKSETYTNWLKRPLTPQQLAYAASDVEHMLPLAEKLKNRLAELGRTAWVEEVLREIYDPSRFETDPFTLYLRVRRASSLSRRELAVLRELAVWREEEAQRTDRPRRSVATDECLIELAKRQPHNSAQLSDMRGLGRRYQREGAPELLEAIRRGKAVPESELPPQIEIEQVEPEVQSTVDLLIAFVKNRGREIGVAPAYLATPEELAQMVRAAQRGEEPPQVRVLSGWRAQCVGRDLLRLLSGEAHLELKGGRVEFVSPAGSDKPGLQPKGGGEGE